ncbi:hypothetical protein BGX21_003418 [Mortierella sp. AD011]|nr:hypothetical protein BGX21_003418 [Mortierella sp. AD011]
MSLAAGAKQPRLDDEGLRMIWDTVDTEKRGILGRNGFNIALRLIGHRQAGKTIIPSLLDLPGQLPRFDVAQATVELEDQQKHAQLNAQHDLADQPKADQGMQTQQGKELGEPAKEAAAQKEVQDQMEQELAKKMAAHKEALDKLEQEHLQLLKTVQEQQQQALFMSLMRETQLYSSFGGGSPAQIAQAQQQKAVTQRMYQDQITQIPEPKPESEQPSITAIDSDGGKVTEPVALAQPQLQQQQYQPPPQLHQQQFSTDSKQYPTQSQTYSVDPRTYVTNPQTYSVDPSTYVIKPQQDLLSTFTSIASKYLRPKQYAADPTQYLAHQQQSNSTNNEFVVRPPAPMPSQLYQYSTDPNQYVVRPQPLSPTHTQPQYQYQSPPPPHRQQYSIDPNQYVVRPQPLSPTHIQQHQCQYQSPPLQQQQQYFPLQSSYPSPITSQPTSPNTNGQLPYESVQQQCQ